MLIANMPHLLQKQMFMFVSTPEIMINNNEGNSDLHEMLHARWKVELCHLVGSTTLKGCRQKLAVLTCVVPCTG